MLEPHLSMKRESACTYTKWLPTNKPIIYTALSKVTKILFEEKEEEEDDDEQKCGLANFCKSFILRTVWVLGGTKALVE